MGQRQIYQKSLISRFYWDLRDKAILSHLRGEKIIDLGCGEGLTLEKIIAHLRGGTDTTPRVKIIGVDRDPQRIKICKKHHLPAKIGDITHLPFPKNSFDCAILAEVIEHLQETEVKKALGEIYRILKPAGRLIVVFPNDRNFKIARIFCLKFKQAFADYGHLRQWHPKKDLNFFHQAGFSLVSQQSIPFFFWPVSLHHLLVLEKKK
jgi:ubiquinone/menaquinone biosynthesis C-methylase UbiE